LAHIPSFVSAVVGVLLVVPVPVSAWSVVARGEIKAVWSVVAGVSLSPYLPSMPVRSRRRKHLRYRARSHAGQRRCCTWMFGLRPSWAAWWHSYPSLVVWAFGPSAAVCPRSAHADPNNKQHEEEPTRPPPTHRPSTPENESAQVVRRHEAHTMQPHDRFPASWA
jgi:hypothetical protein